MTYCDSSFIVSLYSDEGALSAEATRLAARWETAPLLSPYTELEVVNAFLRKVFESPDDEPRVRLWLDRFQRDYREGILEVQHGNHAVILRDARALSLKYTPAGGHRSLDLLHVASAKVLGVKKFLSFDARLNALAKREGLKVLA
jgi:predicted nucleic acid-binding protein